MPLRPHALALLTLAALTASCGDEDTRACDSRISPASITSPSTGVVTITGTFPEDESVLIRYTAGGQDFQRAGIVAGNTLTFQGLPAGTITLNFVVSCSDALEGQEELGPVAVIVK